MGLVLADRVRVRSQSSGTGTLTLTTTVEGFQSFAAIGNGNETYYGIVDNAGNWEIGRGTYTASGTTLSRDTVVSSSNAGAKVNFPAGSKTVFCTFPSSLAQTNIEEGSNILTRVTLDSTNSTRYLMFSEQTSGDVATKVNSNIRVNPSTGALYSTVFYGPLVGDVTGNITGNISGSSTSTTGNAATATALQTARNINGVSFNGTSNITVTADANTLSGTTLKSTVVTSSLTSVGTLTGLTVSGSTTFQNGISVTNGLIAGELSGNAATATSLKTARNINGTPFDGTANITVGIDANSITGTTLNSTVVSSSLTSLGTLTSLNVSGNPVITLPNATSGNFKIASASTSSFSTRIGTSSSNQYFWATNSQFNGTNWVKDESTTGAWRIAHVVSSSDASSVINFNFTTAAGASSDVVVFNNDGSITKTTPLVTRRNSTSQTLSNASNTRVAFNTQEDSNGTIGLTYDASTNIGRFTNTSGLTKVFNVSATIVYATNSTGARITYILKGSSRVAQMTTIPTVGEATVHNVTTPVKLANNEFIEVYAYHTISGGGSLNIGSGGSFNGSYISIVEV
jgi:hypothetical protein